eukprot:gene7628-8237_t
MSDQEQLHTTTNQDLTEKIEEIVNEITDSVQVHADVEETTETVVTPHGTTSVLESEDSVTVTTITYETTDHGDHVTPEKHDDVVLTESVTHHSEHHVNSIVSTTTVTDHTETRTIHTSADNVVDVQVEEHTDVTVSKEITVNGDDVVLEITEQVNDVTITEFHNPHDPNQSKIEIEEVFTAIEKNVSEVASPELPGITTDEVAVVETSTETITVTTHTTVVENEVVVKDEVETVQAEATSIAVNTHFFAYLESQGSGSSIAVLPYTSVGKNHIPVNSPAYQQPIIRAHSQPVSDFAFNPFHSQILYSCAPDRLLKLWKLPSTEGLTVDMSVATNSLSLKSKCALRSLAVSKSIDSLLAVRGSREISIFDMNALKEVYTTTDNNSFWSGDILSMTWSYYNDLLFTSSKDKMIKLFDPRVNPKQFSLVKDWIAHSGFRYSSVIPLEDTFSVYTLGHNSKTQEREIYYWDLRSINPSTGPIIKHVIDKKDGNLFPIYDEDHKLLYVSGKGDSHLHTYQLSSDRTQLNELVNESILTESFHGRDVIKGIALLPKIPSLITNNREVGRILKLSDGLIQPYSINASQPLPSEGFITRSERQLQFYGKNKTLPTSINVSYNETIGSFHQHTNSIRTINFHPTVPSLFCSTSQDMTLRFFDLNNIEEISSLKVFGNVGSVSDALITNISFNYDGTQLLMASKDRQLRSIDPRMNQITNTVQHAKYLGRNLRVAWCARSLAEDPIVTVSAGSGGLRQIALWDRRNWSEPLVVRMIDNASGQLYPMYDEGLNVVYVAGKGDTMIRGYELSSLTTDTPTDAKEGVAEKGDKEYHYMMEKCFDYQVQGRDTIAGVCMLPKRVVDIRAVEVSRILKLSNDTVNEIHFHVPRADYLKDYFHDDIYLPIRSNTESKGTIYDWKSSTNENNELFAPVLESLKPEGMINVSEKPVTPLPSESNSKIHSYRNKIAAKEEETKQNEEKFNKLQQLAFQNAQYHRNSSGPMRIGSVVVTNPQLQESIAKVSAQGGNDDDSDDEVDWS